MEIHRLINKKPEQDQLIWFQPVENQSGLGVVYFGRIMGIEERDSNEYTVTFVDVTTGRELRVITNLGNVYWARYVDLQSQYLYREPKPVDAFLGVNERLQEKVDQAEEIMQEALDWIDEMKFKSVNRRVRDLIHQFIYGGNYHIDEKEY